LYILKQDITDSRGKGYPLADFPREGDVLNKIKLPKSFYSGI